MRPAQTARRRGISEIAVSLIRSLGQLTPSPHPPDLVIIRCSELAAHLSLFKRDVDPVCSGQDGDGREEHWPGADPYCNAEGDYNQSEVHRVACKTGNGYKSNAKRGS